MKNATRALVSTLGAIMGVGGFEHGIGELLQGNTAPSGIMILSWPDSAFFRTVAGEPAMTIVPNLLVTGILSMIVSLIFLIWATMLVQKKNSGVVLILLSIIMLLVGGGIFPPILGIMIGALATRVNAQLAWWRAHLSQSLLRFLAKLWMWSFFANLTAWLLLFPGTSILGYFFGVNNANLTAIIFLFALGSLPITIVAGFARDIERQTDSRPILT